jgi:hypothetical protein
MSACLGDRVRCPVCSRSYAPLKSGLLRVHWARQPDGRGLPFGDPCSGSGQVPAGLKVETGQPVTHQDQPVRLEPRPGDPTPEQVIEAMRDLGRDVRIVDLADKWDTRAAAARQAGDQDRSRALEAWVWETAAAELRALLKEET